MSLRSKVARLALDNPEMREHLAPLLKNALGVPSKGDLVKLHTSVPSMMGGDNDLKRDDELVFLGAQQSFTRQGPQPFATKWHVRVPETGKEYWIWAWNFYGGPLKPKNMSYREPEDDALKAVLKALGPLKKPLHRTTGAMRGTRTLEPKGYGRILVEVEPVLKALSRAFGGSGPSFKVPVQTSKDGFTNFKAVVSKRYQDEEHLDQIHISPV